MLKKLLTASLWLLMAFPAGTVLAQTGTVTGTVTDSLSGDPLPGVNVVVQDQNIGAATDVNGQFEIAGVPTGSQTLVASYIGYRTKQIPITVQSGLNQVDIQMAEEAIGLEDVVVTALGIERAERSLGYAVQEVEGAELERVPEENFVDALQGKVAGADIQTSNSMGGSSRIVLRGSKSIAGNNQPLIVIDGVPLDNSNFREGFQESGYGGYDYGNAAQFVNPDDIQSVSVLKGPAAAALYGSRAANGVIEITTKSGQGLDQGIGVTVNTSVTAEQVYGLPEYQNEYGGGSYRPFSVNEQGQYVVDYGTDQSWGPRLDGRPVREWFSYDEVNGLFGQTTPWEANPNNVQEFFDTGVTYNTSVAFSQGAENYNYRLSLKRFDQGGVFPNSNLERNQVGFKGSLDLTDRLWTSISTNYIHRDGLGRPGTGYNGLNVFQQFNHFGQRQLDMGDGSYMEDIERPDGSQRSWNWYGGPAGALAGSIIYFDNPYWVRQRNFQNDNMKRLFGNVTLGYDFTENLSLTGDLRTDYYNDRRQERIATGSVDQDNYREEIREVQEVNGSARLQYDGNLTDDFSLNALAGTEYRYNNYNRNIGDTRGGLSAPNLFTLENSVSRPSLDDYFEQKGVYSLFGSANVGYRDLVYLEGTLRNDWSSTLPADDNSYLYPSLKGSFVFSSLAPLQNSEILSFGKVRAGWSRAGNDTDPYRLALTYPVGTPFESDPVQSLPSTRNNPTLQPEITTSWEFGTQLQFFRNTVGLDATYYDEVSRNQILPVPVSRASGYEELILNAGRIDNRGVELSLRVSPIQTQSTRWDITANWATNENEVVALNEELNLDSYRIGPTPFGPDVVARVGEPYGTLYGRGFVYDANGDIVLSSSGRPLLSDTRALGSYVPDWTGGVSTTFSYEGFTISALVNGQRGGSIYSVTNLFGLYSGILDETVEGDIRRVGLVPDGVTLPADMPEDAEPSEVVGDPFEERVDPNQFFTGLFGNHEAHTFDASYLKLREISIGYALPQRWYANIPEVRNIRLTVVGRNLATLFKNTPNFDPATALSASNVQGVEAGQIPPSRSFGVNLRVTL